MKRQPLHTLIVLGSLTLSIFSCLLIGAFVSDELHVDRGNKNLNEIVLFRQFEASPLSGGQFATDFKLRFPQVEDAVRMKPMNLLVASGGEGFYESEFYFADPAIVDVFTFQWIKGTPKQALEMANGVVISEQIAAKYFGYEDPIGKVLTVNGKTRFIVQAVFADSKQRSHIQPALMASYKSANEVAGYNVTTNYWGPGSYTYLQVKKGTDIQRFSALLPAYLKSLNDPNAPFVWKPAFIPLKDLYLRTSLISNSPITYVYIFSGAGLLLLLLAGFNYINLATAKVAMRQKNVAIQKILGSSIQSLRVAFMLEAMIYIILSFLLAVLLSFLFMPMVNRWTDFDLSLTVLITPVNLLAAFGFLCILTVLSGTYPALITSSAKPITALRNINPFTHSKSPLRKILVVGQFAVSFIMILVTLVVYNQLHFIKEKNVGYNRDQVLTLDLRDAGKNEKMRFKQMVLDVPRVEAASVCLGLPGSNVILGQKLIEELVPKGSDDASVFQLTIDKDFAKTFGVRLLQGRMLDEDREADQGKFLINESAMKKFGWKDIEGKFVGYYTYQYKADGSYEEVPLRGEVVGVLADYNHSDLKSPIEATLFSLNSGYESKMGIKLKGGSLSAVLPLLEQKWHTVFPDKPFSYTFLDDAFNKSYSKEIQTGKVFAAFSGVTIFISCMGLFGLVFFALQRRQREMSIRKVLGAKVSDIAATISKEFFLLILIACLLGMPVAWISVNQWLEMFAYRIDVGAWLMLLPLLLLLILVSISIGWHVLKAAASNPVNNLRSE